MNNQLNNQKNRFWTFWISLIPGAGEMYFGLYRFGFSLMMTFVLMLLVPLSLNFGGMMLLAPVLWCYSFLHTRNLRAMPLEEFCQLEDNYFWVSLFPGQMQWKPRHTRIFAWVLIILGSWLVWNNLQGYLTRYLPGVLSALIWRVPQMAIGAAILLVGVRLILGKKQDLEEEEAQEEAQIPDLEEANLLTETAQPEEEPHADA